MRIFREVSARFHNTQHPFSVLRLADAALSAALMANSGTTTEAADAFLRVREEMLLYSSPPPRQDSDAPEDHRRRLPDANIALAAAWEKDERSIRVLSQVESEFPTRVSHPCRSRKIS